MAFQLKNVVCVCTYVFSFYRRQDVGKIGTLFHVTFEDPPKINNKPYSTSFNKKTFTNH